MAKISKDIDLDTTVVKLKLVLKGNRNIQTIYCTVAQAIEFTDYINENRFVIRNKHEKQMMENKFYIFDDIVNKKNVMVSIPDVKYMEVPFFIDAGQEYDVKILTIN